MPSTTGSLLPDDDFNELQAIADQFAAARQHGPVADWLPFVPPRDDRKHRDVLRELVKVDLEASWSEGRATLVDTYIERFPGLEPLPADLIIEEYRLRRLHGQAPALDEYRVRFPDSFAEIERKVRELPAPSKSPSATPTQRQIDQTPAPPPAQPSASGPVFPEGYKPIMLIGRGNFGEVWRAEAPGGVEVAIKVVSQPLDNDAAQRELNALGLVKKLRHPALLATLAFWVIQNRLVIAMELADCSLRDRLKFCKQKGLTGIPAEELLSYFRDAAAGLDELHWQKVLHRDIKPENILLTKGYAKVADFGLARMQSKAMMSVSFAGTPAFMAPEMWGGKANERSDQYSLAFTYAELRLGRRPLEGDDFTAVMRSTLEGEPDLGDLPPAEKTVLKRALDKRPENRFDTCTQFVEALERALSPDGRISRPRPSAVEILKPGSATGTSKTELSDAGLEAVRAPVGAVETTFAGETSEQTDTPKTKPAVWKPPGPSAPVASGRHVILFAIVGLLIVGIGAALVWFFVIHNLGPTSSEQTGKPTQPTPPTKPTNGVKPTPKKTEPDKKPIDTADWMPAGFVSAAGAELKFYGGKKYWSKIVPKELKAQAAFIFLFPARDGEQPPAFYMMEDKAWNALFEEYLLERPDVKTQASPGNSLWPVRNVTVAVAEGFARWLHGELPTVQQWDHAAGFWNRDGRDGPAKRGVVLGIARNEPLPIDGSDVSPYGIIDMSANGREFTRNSLPGGDDRLIVLRGRMFTLSKPLTYDDLRRERDDPTRTQTQFRDKPSLYTGFRVVIEVPR